MIAIIIALGSDILKESETAGARHKLCGVTLAEWLLRGSLSANDLAAFIVKETDLDRLIDEQAGKAEVEYLTVRNRVQLSDAEGVIRSIINARHIDNGVTLIDPKATYIDAGVKIGPKTLLYPGCVLEGETVVGEGCTITQSSRIIDSVIGDGTSVQASLITDSAVGKNANIGPFVQLRPHSNVGDNCRVGNFVEIKNSSVANSVSISHLSYIGDGDVGEGTNIGCGVIFSNYDGVKKHRTVVGKNCFIGCNTNLVPPVNVGDNAFIAAGSTITEDVPEGALGIARARQVNKEGWKTERDRVYRKDLPQITKTDVNIMLKGSVTESLIGVLSDSNMSIEEYRSERLEKFDE